MAKRKNDRIVDLDAKRAERAKKQPRTSKRVESQPTPVQPILATRDGLCIRLPNQEQIVLRPESAARWNEMWKALARDLQPRYLECLRELRRGEKAA